ncbi:hypothetical protein P8452_12819 [Trifolium repens]|nr:hypothetical protein P8452_12819 [Trifolium repens]
MESVNVVVKDTPLEKNDDVDQGAPIIDNVERDVGALEHPSKEKSDEKTLEEDAETSLRPWHPLPTLRTGPVADLCTEKVLVWNGIFLELAESCLIIFLDFISNDEGLFQTQMTSLWNDSTNHWLAPNKSSKTLYLYGNNLTGSIPENIGELQNHQELALQENWLSGSIPLSIGRRKNLKKLLLYSNQFSARYPFGTPFEDDAFDLIILGKRKPIVFCLEKMRLI